MVYRNTLRRPSAEAAACRPATSAASAASLAASAQTTTAYARTRAVQTHTVSTQSLDVASAPRSQPHLNRQRCRDVGPRARRVQHLARAQNRQAVCSRHMCDKERPVNRCGAWPGSCSAPGRRLSAARAPAAPAALQALASLRQRPAHKRPACACARPMRRPWPALVPRRCPLPAQCKW